MIPFKCCYQCLISFLLYFNLSTHGIFPLLPQGCGDLDWTFFILWSSPCCIMNYFLQTYFFFVYKKNRETLLFTICLSGSVSVFHEIFISWSVYTSWFGSTALWKFSMNLADTACIFSSCSKTLWPMVLLSNYSSTCCQHAGKRRFYVCRHRTYYSVYSEFKSQ